MRFLDSNVFIYAFYKPKRRLGATEELLKSASKAIVTDVSKGNESVVTTIVHVSELVNVLKHGMSPGQLAEAVKGVLASEYIEVLPVDKDDYLSATELGRELQVDSNDALAVQVMRSKGLKEIYSFDKAFDRLEGITRLPKMPSP